jgi:phage N-6-adenine-methyltransferase
MFTSDKHDWETPDFLFEALDKKFHFTLDVCAEEHNKKLDNYFSPEQNALEQKWEGVCWMNPPYGINIKHWVRKAFLAAKEGATVVCLLPARTDTRWFHNYCIYGEVTFIKGRLKFGGGEKVNPAPFPNMIVVFTPDMNEATLKTM